MLTSSGYFFLRASSKDRTYPSPAHISPTSHDCAKSSSVRRCQILEADRSRSDRLLVGQFPRPPARLQTPPPRGFRLPIHRKYPFGREWVRVLRTVPVSKLCGLVP